MVPDRSGLLSPILVEVIFLGSSGGLSASAVTCRFLFLPKPSMSSQHTTERFQISINIACRDHVILVATPAVESSSSQLFPIHCHCDIINYFAVTRIRREIQSALGPEEHKSSCVSSLLTCLTTLHHLIVLPSKPPTYHSSTKMSSDKPQFEIGTYHSIHPDQTNITR